MPVPLSSRVWEASVHLPNITKSVSIKSRHDLLADNLSQEFKDVEDKLGDLIPWLNKLRESMTAVRTDDNREDTERREQLTRFISHIHRFNDSS